MEGIVATLTDEEQARLRAIVKTGMSAHGTRLAGVVGIHFHRHTSRKHRLVGKVAMQFGKGPLGGMSVRSALLLRGLLPMLAPCALTDVHQVFQANDAVWVALHNAPTDEVVGSLFQPSLPSTDHDQSPGSRTGAFVLQPLYQAAVMVSFGPGLFAGIEGCTIVQLRCDRQVALSHIHADHVLVGFGHRVCSLQCKRDEQIKLLTWLVIPQLGCPDMRSLLHKRNVLTVARIGHEHPPRERQDTHLLSRLQAVVAVVVVGECRGGVLGWLIESLVAFLGETRLASFCIPPYLGPQGFVGSPDLTRNIT